MNIADIIRRLESLIKIGVIHAVDYQQARARVQSGQIISDWLPFLTLRAGTTVTWSPPTVGEQCLLLAPSGELNTGVVITGIYLKNQSPSNSSDEHVIQFADGATIIYNQQTHALIARGISTALIQASQSITADTPNVTCTGNVHVKGNITVDGDVVASGISLVKHIHPGDSGGETGKPQ
ncbi:baseplate assembly protein [Gallibacterium genomosp. 3]|uniref:Baseplate assembly protein n=1 Tax=Gallibacterium genomosp. 3 TaxID=505345 RepID=A0A1A7PXR2_9PAST|nr:phage baseplate assembly protein V [Gallibacterium genomosp. 3]OBX05940.1 baseplate assembly protein [Gallibacterium genomosp. 3]